MSNTPRVDEFCKTSGGQYTYDLSGLARHLERELAAAQAKIARLTKRKDECSNGWDEAMAQRDKVRDDALEQAAKVCETHQDDRNRHNYTKDAYIATLQCAAAIRAMKVEK
jgi:hypothetical protein